MDGYKNARSLLPPELGAAFPDECPTAEELRLRCGHAPGLYDGLHERYMRFRPITELDLRRVLERVTGASLHTAADALRRGYVCSHGLRIGVCGSAVVRGGRMEGFREFTSLAIRIPHDCRDICRDAVDTLINDPNGCLIIGAPGSGKTTALREMIRCLSNHGFRIAAADERGEISGDGEFDLGRCSDVITGLCKAEASMMLLRGMNPDFIAMDEITQYSDADAIREICCCGVRLLATAHARTEDELRRRPVFNVLLDTGAFGHLIIVSGAGIERQYALKELSI